MKFFLAFSKNLAFVGLLLIIASSAVWANCLDHLTNPQIDSAKAHESHQHSAQDVNRDLKQCHISASDGFAGYAKISISDEGVSSMESAALVLPLMTYSARNELSFLIKSLSLAPPPGPPRAL